MSDSGPIISPPPAFSTPVTPMIDRQNSTTSDKSGGGAAVSNSTANHTSGGTNNVGRLRSLSQSTSHYHNITGFSLAPAPTNIPSSAGVVGSNMVSTTATKSHSQTQSSQQQAKQQSQHHHYHAPLSGTVSMSAISSTVNGRGGGGGGTTRNNKSIPDLSSADISLRYSPMSRSRSNSSPMSPEESIPATSPDEEDDDDDDDADEDPTSSSLADNGHDGDDDCSEKGQSSSISPKLIMTGVVRRNSTKLQHHQQPQIAQQQQQQQPHTKKVTLIPKSVTENFLYKVSSTSGASAVAIAGAVGDNNDVVKTSSMGAQTDANQQSRSKTTPEGNKCNGFISITENRSETKLEVATQTFHYK